MNSNDAEIFTVQSIHKTVIESVDALRQQRGDLVNDITKMNDEVIEMSRRFEKIRKRHEEELQTIIAEKSDKHQELLSLRQEVLRLKSSTESMEPIKRHLDVSINDKQNQVIKLDEKLEASRSLASEYARQIEQARSLWNEVIARTTEETHNLENIKNTTKQLEPHRIEVQELNISIQKMHVDEMALNESIVKYKKAESDLRSVVSELTVNYEKQRRDELELIKKQHELELQIAKIRLEHDSLVGKNQELKKENHYFDARIKEYSEKKSVLEAEIKDTQNTLQQLHINIIPLKNQIQTHQEELERINREVDFSRNTLMNLSSQIVEKEHRYDEQKQEYENLIVENRRLDATIHTLKEQEQEWREKIVQVQQENSQYKKEISNQQRNLEELVIEVTNYQKSSERCQVESAALLQDLSITQHGLAKAQEEKRGTINEIHALEIENQKLQLQKNSLEENLVEHLKNKDLLGTEYKQGLENFEALNATIADKNALLKTIEEQAIKFESKRAELELQIKNHADTQAVQEKQIEQNKNKLKECVNLEAEIARVQIKIRDLLKEEETLTQNINNAKKLEGQSANRLMNLEHQESEIIGRLELARAELAQAEIAFKDSLTKQISVEEALDKLNKELLGANKKREALAELLKKDTDAVREGRQHLREIEQLQNNKLKEIAILQQENTSILPSIANESSGEKTPVTTSAQVRADSEKTLELLRRHLNSVSPTRK